MESASAGLTGAPLKVARLQRTRNIARRAIAAFFWPTAAEAEEEHVGLEDTPASANFYCVVLYELRHAKTGMAIVWAMAGVGLALLQLLAIYSVAITSLFPACLYREDCRLGTVCAIDINLAANINLAEAQCFPCDFFYPSNDNFPQLHLTSRSTSGFQSDSNITSACERILRLPELSTWPTPPTDFNRCLHVEASLMRLSHLGKLVLVGAYVFMSGSVASERHQQLYNRELRYAWFPPPHRSWRAMCIKLMEMLLWPGVLTSILLSLILLLAATSFSAQDVLLNGLSLSFLLVIDDELVGFVLSGPRLATIEQAAARTMAERVSTCGAPLLRLNAHKACASFFLSAFTLASGLGVIANLSCGNGNVVVVTCIGGVLSVGGTIMLDSALHTWLVPSSTARERVFCFLMQIGVGVFDGFVATSICFAIWYSSAILNT